MAVKLFNRIGLRRDFNLSDLISQDTALNNILRTDSMSDGFAFTTDDLAPIKNIYVTDITASTFLTLDGILVQFTQITIDATTGLPEIQNEGNPEPYRPFVKIKNRLDTAYFTTGEPFFFGGDGPNATYYDSSNIIREPEDLILTPASGSTYGIGDIIQSNGNIYRVIEPNTSSNSQLLHTSGAIDGFLFERAYDPKEVFYNGLYDTITGQDRTESDNFWERGFFLYGDKIRDTYLSSFGGVKWTGYFKPIISGAHRFYIRTTGNCQFKFQDPLVLSSVESKYGQPDTAYITGLIGSSSGNTQVWRQSLFNILTDPTRKFVEIRLQTALLLSTDDILYVDTLQGQLNPKQYKISTIFPTGEVNSVDRIWVEATEDFNRKNVLITDLPAFGAGAWADVDGNRSFIRYYPYERRGLKTYLNSIYKQLELSSGNFTLTSNTITFTGGNADLYYYQMMENDYIYDYRLRDNGETQRVRRYIVTGLNDSLKRVTVSLDTSYTGAISNDNNDQVARIDSGNLYVFTEDYGGFPPFGATITSTYTTGGLNDVISSSSLTNNLHFVARFGTTGDDIRKKFISIDQFIPKYEECAFELTFFMKDQDVPFPVDEKGIVIWYSDENSGYDPVSYKHFYDPNYEFFQIGDFRTFLNNTIGFGGTSRETGIEQRAFGKPQLLTAGDQYQTFYSTLPVNSIYTPKVRWNDVTSLQTSSATAGNRKLRISDVVSIEIGNYIYPNDIAGIKGETLLSRGTRVIEILDDVNSVNGDAITSKITLGTTSSSQFIYFNHRGFVNALHVRPKSTNDFTIFTKPGMPVGSCKYLVPSTVSVKLVNSSNEESGTTVAFVNPGQSGSSSSNGVTITYSSDASGTTFTGEGIGQIFTYETYPDGMDEVKPGMVFVSNRDPADQEYYTRILGYNDPNNDGIGLLFLNRALEDVTSGDRIGAIYYDKGIDIVKPLETYCNGIACNQNAYQTEVVVNDDDESEIVTFNNTNYIAPLIYTSNQSSFDSGHGGQSGSTSVQMQITTTDFATYWFDNLSGRNDDYEPLDGSTASYYRDDIVHISLRSTDPLNSAIEEKGFPNTATLIGSNDYIPIGRIVGYIKIRRNSNYQYHYIVKLNPKAYVWGDTDTVDGNVKSKQIDWTKFNTSDYWVQRWSYKNRSNRISKGANVTNKTTLGNTAGSTGSDQYYKVTSSITISSAEAISWFHNPNSIPANPGSTNRILPSNSYVRRTEIDGTTKLVYFNEFSEFQGAYSVYGKHYTGTTDTGLTVTDNIGNSNLRIHPIINMQDQDFNPAKRTSTNVSNDPFEFLQFRSKIYELVKGNSQIESFIPFVRFVNPFATTSGVETRIQNSMNPLTVYTFTNTTTNRELCCPPLDTSPPFDSSAIGLSTTINEPDMGIDGGLNVRVISARHPVADIIEIPANISTTQLEVNKKLKIEFSGETYDLLIGDSIPFVP